MAERRRGNEAPAHNRKSVVDGGGRQSSPRFGGRWEKRRGDRRTPEAKFFGRPQAREKAGRDGRTQAEGEEMSPDGPTEERVIYRERFQAAYFDFRGKSIFTRYDRCEFVKCTLLVDHNTEQLAFTACVFKDCNIDRLEPDEARGLYVRDNFFDRPLEERRAEFENRLAQALAARKAKGK
jgi:hypothetical protein